MLFIDGKMLFKYLEGEERVHRVKLEPGLAACTLVSFAPSSKVNVLWQPPGFVELGPIPPENLYHDPAELRPQFPGYIAAPH